MRAISRPLQPLPLAPFCLRTHASLTLLPPLPSLPPGFLRCPACSDIKERTKKVKADKAVQKAQAKAAGGGKAAKNMPKGGASKGGSKSTGR